jgi:stearoyl-CoA desaturase (Delta-9 desaturase)
VTGVTATSLVLCVALYFIRMFGVSAGYHRYFSHRAFKTSRAGQFALAVLAQSSAQRGVLWWAAKHRHHHKHSDMPEDVHSPRHRGFWYAHLGWIFTPQHERTDLSAIPDLVRYPELRLLDSDKWRYVPAILLAVGTLLVAGWPGLVVGFFWSTVLLYHGTFMINSLAHVHGTQRYVTGDDSRNNWWLALFTGGEGWHNNHHAYMASTRQGFRWWEVDPTFYMLKALSWVGVVWDLKEPPAELVRNEKALGRGVVEKAAWQLAGSVSVSAGAWSQVPPLEELRVRAGQMFAATPALDDIAGRAREIILQRVAAEREGSSRSAECAV